MPPEMAKVELSLHGTPAGPRRNISYGADVHRNGSRKTCHGRRRTHVCVEKYFSKENAVNSKDHTTLVAAVKAAGLVDTLQGAGPFTVFAPTDEALKKLPAGTVEMLVKPENKTTLTKILTYHVVSGRLTTADLMKIVKDGHGKTTLKTVQGDPLTVSESGTHLMISGEKSGVAEISIPNVMQSNGVIQVVDFGLVAELTNSSNKEAASHTPLPLLSYSAGFLVLNDIR